jgi:hypothetical protein
MKKYKILYWAEVDDSKDYFEIEVNAKRIDDALAMFRDLVPLALVESINLVL